MATQSDHPIPNSGRGESGLTRDRNIVITGFMATGKTTIGRLIAEKTGRPFIDTDVVIVARAGKSIPDIFAQDGEAVFRQMEHDLAGELAEQQGLVIATGGGMLVDPVNRDRLLHSAFVVCLDTPPDVIAARLAEQSGRPLAAEWQALYETRRAAYAAIPDHVNTGDKSLEAVTESVIALWQTAST